MFYLPHVKKPVKKGHLSFRDTMSGILSDPEDRFHCTSIVVVVNGRGVWMCILTYLYVIALSKVSQLTQNITITTT